MDIYLFSVSFTDPSVSAEPSRSKPKQHSSLVGDCLHKTPVETATSLRSKIPPVALRNCNHIRCVCVQTAIQSSSFIRCQQLEEQYFTTQQSLWNLNFPQIYQGSTSSHFENNSIILLSLFDHGDLVAYYELNNGFHYMGVYEIAPRKIDHAEC